MLNCRPPPQPNPLFRQNRFRMTFPTINLHAIVLLNILQNLPITTRGRGRRLDPIFALSPATSPHPLHSAAAGLNYLQYLAQAMPPSL